MKVSTKARELVDYARTFGFEIVRAKNHIVMRREDGLQVSLPSTPGDERGVLNKKAEIRRLVKAKQNEHQT